MACENLVGGCFAGGLAPFAKHQSDLEAAAEYLKCCVKAQRSWSDVEKDIRDYLASRGVSNQQHVQKQVARAQKLILPWLGLDDDTDSPFEQ